MWNEQNLRREWEGFPLEPASYMDLLKRSYNAIKGACPGMLVISGATTPAGYSDVAFDDIDYLRGMYQNGLAAIQRRHRHSSQWLCQPAQRAALRIGTSGNYDALSHVNHRSFYFLSTLRRVAAGDGGVRRHGQEAVADRIWLGFDAVALPGLRVRGADRRSHAGAVDRGCLQHHGAIPATWPCPCYGI